MDILFRRNNFRFHHTVIGYGYIFRSYPDDGRIQIEKATFYMFFILLSWLPLLPGLQ